MTDHLDHDNVKRAVLAHVQALFRELEADMAMSHQEKYALLEDALANAADVDELRIAFEQWYLEHAPDLGLEHEVAELWDQAVAAIGE